MTEQVEKRKVATIHTLRCPHGTVVTVAKKFGVIRYLHDDGRPCQSMNRFDVSGRHLIGQMAGSQLFDLRKKVVLIGFQTDRAVRTHVYKTIDIMDAVTLTDALLILIKYCKIDRSGTPLYQEMSTEFGVTFQRNIQFLTQSGVVSHYMKSASDRRKPHFKMTDLDRAHLGAGIAGIKSELYQHESKRRSALVGHVTSTTGDSDLDELLDSLDL